MSPLKVIAASIAGLLLIPVLVIGAVAGGFGDLSGAGGGGEFAGDPGSLEAAVLENPAIHFTQAARADVAAGAIDPRVLQILLLIAQRHELGPIGPLITGHSTYVKGTTRVSNHASGRAVDILGVDGVAVSPSNETAREVMEAVLTLDPPLLPDEVGGPWVIWTGSRSSFTNADHQDHIHIGWDS